MVIDSFTNPHNPVVAAGTDRDLAWLTTGFSTGYRAAKNERTATGEVAWSLDREGSETVKVPNAIPF